MYLVPGAPFNVTFAVGSGGLTSYFWLKSFCTFTVTPSNASTNVVNPAESCKIYDHNSVYVYVKEFLDRYFRKRGLRPRMPY